MDKIKALEFPDIDQFRKALSVKPLKLKAGKSYMPGRDMLAVTPEAHQMTGDLIIALVSYVPASLDAIEEAFKLLIDLLPAEETAQYMPMLHEIIEKRATLQGMLAMRTPSE